MDNMDVNVFHCTENEFDSKKKNIISLMKFRLEQLKNNHEIEDYSIDEKGSDAISLLVIPKCHIEKIDIDFTLTNKENFNEDID